MKVDLGSRGRFRIHVMRQSAVALEKFPHFPDEGGLGS